MAMTEVIIDLNIRTTGGLTYAGLDDVNGDTPVEGESVIVREVESGLTGRGRVDRVDQDKGLVYLEVDWSSLSSVGAAVVRESHTGAGTVIRAAAWHHGDVSGSHLSRTGLPATHRWPGWSSWGSWHQFSCLMVLAVATLMVIDLSS